MFSSTSYQETEFREQRSSHQHQSFIFQRTTTTANIGDHIDRVNSEIQDGDLLSEYSSGGKMVVTKSADDEVGGTDAKPNQQQPQISEMERLIRTHSIWFIPDLSRENAVNILHAKEEGVSKNKWSEEC